MVYKPLYDIPSGYDQQFAMENDGPNRNRWFIDGLPNLPNY